MTQPVHAQITGGSPVRGKHDDLSIEALLSEELKDLRDEVEALVQNGLSEEEARGLLDWASKLEGNIKAIASVLENPSPETVSKYLRYVASQISSTRSRASTASSLRLLQAALLRVSGNHFTPEDLKGKSLADLDKMARGMGLKGYNKLDRKGMSDAILKRVDMSKSPEER